MGYETEKHHLSCFSSIQVSDLPSTSGEYSSVACTEMTLIFRALSNFCNVGNEIVVCSKCRLWQQNVTPSTEKEGKLFGLLMHKAEYELQTFDQETIQTIS